MPAHPVGKIGRFPRRRLHKRSPWVTPPQAAVGAAPKAWLEGDVAGLAARRLQKKESCVVRSPLVRRAAREPPSRCLRDASHGLRGADRGDGARRGYSEGDRTRGGRSIESTSSSDGVGPRASDRNDAAGRDVDIFRRATDGPAQVDGQYDDWDVVEELWSRAFSRMTIQGRDQPVLAAYPSWGDADLRATSARPRGTPRRRDAVGDAAATPPRRRRDAVGDANSRLPQKSSEDGRPNPQVPRAAVRDVRLRRGLPRAERVLGRVRRGPRVRARRRLRRGHDVRVARRRRLRADAGL